MESPEASQPLTAFVAVEKAAFTLPPRPRQQRLFAAVNPFAGRLGREFFRGLPETPGVYFYYDETGRLLYIGQSCNLRARIGSYRHVSLDRHPRRTCRLVFRIARVEIQHCETAREAAELESALLLERRPPFNRSGVWIPPPWHCRMECCNGFLTFQLFREACPDGLSTGPLPSSFRYTLAALARCLCRWLHPGLPLADFPHRMLHASAGPLLHRLPLPDVCSAENVADQVKAFIAGEESELTELLAAVLPGDGATPAETEFWAEQLEAVQKFHVRRKALAFLAEEPAPQRSAGIQLEFSGFA